MRALLPRLWFQHFTGTSWVAETPDGRLAGFVVAFISPDDPTTGYVHMIARRPEPAAPGIGRALYERVFADLAAPAASAGQGGHLAGNRPRVAFHRAIGFRIDDGPGTQRPVRHARLRRLRRRR